MKRPRSICYCINLRRAANSLTAIYGRHLSPLGISVNQFSLLRNIDRLGTCSVSDLASCVGLDRTPLTRTLRPLLDRGLVVDTAKDGHRDRALQLTDEGRALKDRGGPMWDAAQAEVERRIGADEARALMDLLEKLED